MPREEGAVLLMVLIGLAILAALTGVALRLGQSGLQGLSAENAVFNRSLTEDSALAAISDRLGRKDLPEDGTPMFLTIAGGRVEARVHAAAGMVNPAHARPQVLETLLQLRGADPDEALHLTRAILAVRSTQPPGALAGPWEFAPLFQGDPALWRRIAPDLTFLGNGSMVSPDLAPPDLRPGLAAVVAAGVDLTASPPQPGLFEIDIRPLPAPGETPLPFVRFSVLRDRLGRMHQLLRSWPMEMPQ